VSADGAIMAWKIDSSKGEEFIIFLGQQNIMLDLENKALKQLLESLSHEHFIKHRKYSSFFPRVSLVTYVFRT